MTEWWSYRPEDFLMFSPRVYWRLFELHNQALWPLQIAALAAGLVMVVLAVRHPRGHGRWIAIILAALWAFVGWAFLWDRYATINWAAAYVAPVFAIEAAILAVAGGASNRLSFDHRGAAGVIGLALVAASLIGLPLLAPLSGRPWMAAQIFGIAPDPTAIGTLGLLLLARGRWTALLYPIPLLWCMASAATLWTMGEADAWIPAAAAALAVAAATAAAIRDRVHGH